MNNRGVQLLEAGRFDDAIALFEQAADGMTTNRVINLNAARAHILKMERFGANPETIGRVRGYVERVRQFAPDDTGLAQVTERYQRLVLKGVPGNA